MHIYSNCIREWIDCEKEFLEGGNMISNISQAHMKQIAALKESSVKGDVTRNAEQSKIIKKLQADNLEPFKGKRLKEIEDYFAQKDACERVDFEVYKMIKFSSHSTPYIDNWSEIVGKCHGKSMEGGAAKGQWEKYYTYFQSKPMVNAEEAMEYIKSHISTEEEVILQEHAMLSQSQNSYELLQKIGNLLSHFEAKCGQEKIIALLDEVCLSIGEQNSSQNKTGGIRSALTASQEDDTTKATAHL